MNFNIFRPGKYKSKRKGNSTATAIPVQMRRFLYPFHLICSVNIENVRKRIEKKTILTEIQSTYCDQPIILIEIKRNCFDSKSIYSVDFMHQNEIIHRFPDCTTHCDTQQQQRKSNFKLTLNRRPSLHNRQIFISLANE